MKIYAFSHRVNGVLDSPTAQRQWRREERLNADWLSQLGATFASLYSRSYFIFYKQKERQLLPGSTRFHSTLISAAYFSRSDCHVTSSCHPAPSYGRMLVFKLGLSLLLKRHLSPEGRWHRREGEEAARSGQTICRMMLRRPGRCGWWSQRESQQITLYIRDGFSRITLWESSTASQCSSYFLRCKIKINDGK